MGKWSDLTAQQKAAVIKFAMDNGVSDINSIRDTYNLYSSGFENVYKEGGNIHIKPSKRGTFTAAATKHGKSVQEFARQVLANPENYSPAMRRKANFARNSAKWHKHEEGGSNWLPDFTYNHSIQSDNGRQLIQSVLQDENVQRAVQQKALQRQAEIEAQRKAVSEIYNGIPNPGAGYVSGTDPLLQAIVDMTPAGDVEMATEAVSELKSGNLKEAGILGAALLIPNALNKGFKEWRKGRKLSKELSEIPLVQTVSNDEINNWLAERWYKNEIHELPPRLGDRTVDVSEFNKYGIPRHLSVIENMPTTNPNPSNTLIHVDHRLPLIPDRTGFRPLPHDYSTPAVWWNRDYPYYPAPATLTPIGHTLKVKEGRIRALDPSVRTPNSYGPTVVTEGVLPYDALEGIRFNADQSWFEREVFKQSPARWDYFKYGPAWLTYSTGGPLYPFSFQKNPYWKTPAVRYDEGGLTRNWDNTLTGKLINYVENSDSIGWNPVGRTWEHPTLSGYDKNQVGMGVDKNKTPGYWDYIQYRPKTKIPFLTELDERTIRHNAIEAANISANARYKYAQTAVNRPKGTISPVKDAAVVSAIYNLGAGNVANGLFEDKAFMLKLFDGTDKEVVDRINQEYKKKNRNERIAKTNAFLFTK